MNNRIITETIHEDKYQIDLFFLAGINNDAPCITIYNNNAQKEYNRTIESIRFRTIEERRDYIEKFQTRVRSRIADKLARKQAKKEFKNPAKVGDILYSSWGYDQTNVDFYQVKTVLTKSVVIQKIKGRYVESLTDMSENVAAVKDNFVEDEKPMLKRVYKDGDGYAVSLNSYSSAWLDNGQSHYQSHYH